MEPPAAKKGRQADRAVDGSAEYEKPERERLLVSALDSVADLFTYCGRDLSTRTIRVRTIALAAVTCVIKQQPRVITLPSPIESIRYRYQDGIMLADNRAS